ncbi:hypothetical protein AaE_013383 [Aphanomyces astaci]|uniref:Uncharacterized protein n=1 Tax=Aphanomyces astaci TaxID=112090 RepID=A0A6A4ZBK9_APHAT|nr:hypothetical protein AaE_013383 [Aphanomyces astaci]
MKHPKRKADDTDSAGTPEPKRRVSILGRMESSPIAPLGAMIDSLDEAEAFLDRIDRPALARLSGRIVFTDRRVSGSSVLTVFFVAADDDASIEDLQSCTCHATGEAKRPNMLLLYSAVVFDVPLDHDFIPGRVATSTRTSKHKRDNGNGPFTCYSNVKSWAFAP